VAAYKITLARYILVAAGWKKRSKIEPTFNTKGRNWAHEKRRISFSAYIQIIFVF
jgi:hypothetical protein